MKIALKHILVATDFSDSSEAALRYGVAFVDQFGASLHLVHVLDVIPGVDPDPLLLSVPERRQVEEGLEAAAWDDLRRLVPPEEQARLRAVLAIEWGTPSEEIVRYAKAHAIDLIAMGAHGRGGVKLLLMGSVAELVVREAPCPVLTVRHPGHDFVRP
jgi:nucleotide-binding universal stress UspA family protein